jgi:hypothetical protein
MRLILAGLLLSFLFSLPARALVEVGGKEPVRDQNWPVGTLDVANHKSRLIYHTGGLAGSPLTFLYRGNTETLSDVLAKFAQIKAPDLLVVVHDGVHESWLLERGPNKAKQDNTVDWSFAVWTPEDFYRHLKRSGRALPSEPADLPPPRLDVYVSEGRVDWDRAQVPQGLRLIDERTIAHGYKPEDGSVVSGVAYDMITSKPIAGGELTIERQVQHPPAGAADESKMQPEETSEKVASAVADADGRFELKNIPPGKYSVILRASGYASRFLDFEPFSAHTFKSYTVRLLPGVEATGKVVGDADKPLEGVKIRIEGMIAVDGHYYSQPDGHETLTDASGNFTFTGLPRGEAQFYASVSGHYQTDALKQTHPVPPAQPIVLKMSSTGTIHVKATAPDGSPLVGASVNIWPEGGLKVGTWGGVANLKDDGTFTFENVPPGKYLASTDPGAQFSKTASGTPFEVKAGRTVEVEVTK